MVQTIRVRENDSLRYLAVGLRSSPSASSLVLPQKKQNLAQRSHEHLQKQTTANNSSQRLCFLTASGLCPAIGQNDGFKGFALTFVALAPPFCKTFTPLQPHRATIILPDSAGSRDR